MYSPYSNNTKRNKSRLYLFLFLAFLLLIFYWKYSKPSIKSPRKRNFQSVGENIDSSIGQAKDKLNHGIDHVKDKLDAAAGIAKDKVKKVADTVEQAAGDVKAKL